MVQMQPEGIPATNTVAESQPPDVENNLTRASQRVVTPLAVLAGAAAVLPVILTAAASQAAAAAAGLTAQPLLLRTLQFFSLTSLIRRRRSPWGEVIDEVTEAVVPGALVELVETNFKRTVDRTVTDEEGRFVMLVSKAGSFIFRITARGFERWQSPRPFTIKNVVHYVPQSLTVALTPQTVTVSQDRLKQILLTQQVARGISYTKIPLMVIGVALTGLVLLHELSVGAPTALTMLIGMLYLLLVANELRHLLLKRPYGKVLDAANSQPLDLAIVRAFNILKGKKRLIQSAVSDRFGRFFFLVSAGTYQFDAIRPNYHPYRSAPRDLKGRGTLVNQQIKLKRSS